jgi:hypothetical protein
MSLFPIMLKWPVFPVEAEPLYFHLDPAQVSCAPQGFPHPTIHNCLSRKEPWAASFAWHGAELL